MSKGIVLFLLYIIVVLTSAKQIEERKSRLILEFDWPVPKKNLQRFPHAVSCSHFYTISPSRGQVLKKCPYDELFDYRTLRCQQKTTAKCWSDLLKRGKSKKKVNIFKCPFPWGLFPNTDDCSMFHDCLGGIPYARKCPDNYLFDKAERNCVQAKEAMCADHKDIVEPGYKCPYKWGFFTHSKDCSKYYECLRKVPNIRTCKKNMLFDNFARRCLPVNDVECGERFNPYGFDQVKPENKPDAAHQTPSPDIPDEWKSTRVDNITADDKINRLPRIHLNKTINHIFTKLKMGNEWATRNLISTKHPGEITEQFSTGRPRETTCDFPTENPRKTTVRFPTRYSWETTNGYSTRRPSETTNRFSTGRPWETTNRFSSGRPWKTSNEYSTRDPWVTTNSYSTRRPWETTNGFSTGRLWETTNRISTERPWKTTNSFSTEGQWETSKHFPSLRTDRNTHGSESSSTFHIPSNTQKEITNRFSSMRSELITENFPTTVPKETADLNFSGPYKVSADIPSSKQE